MKEEVLAESVMTGDRTGDGAGHWTAITDAERIGQDVRFNVRYDGDGALETHWYPAAKTLRLIRA